MWNEGECGKERCVRVCVEGEFRGEQAGTKSVFSWPREGSIEKTPLG